MGDSTAFFHAFIGIKKIFYEILLIFHIFLLFIYIEEEIDGLLLVSDAREKNNINFTHVFATLVYLYYMGAVRHSFLATTCACRHFLSCCYAKDRGSFLVGCGRGISESFDALREGWLSWRDDAIRSCPLS